MANNLKSNKNQRKVIPVSEKEIFERNQERRERARARKKAAAKKTRKMPDKQYEILIVLSIGLAILLGISIYFKNGPGILKVLRYFAFGSVGITAYLLPIVLLACSLFMIPNRGSRKLNDKIKQVSFLLFNISVFAHIIYISQPQIHLKFGNARLFFPALANYFRVSANHHVSGGFVGGLFGDVVLILLGKWGAVIFMAILFLILFLVLTEITLTQVYTVIQKIGQRLMAWLRQLFARMAEKKEKESDDGWEQTIIQAELAELEAKNQAESKAQETMIEEKELNNRPEKQEEEKAKKKSFFRDIIRPKQEISTSEQDEQNSESEEGILTGIIEEEKKSKEWSEENEANSQTAMEDIAEKLKSPIKEEEPLEEDEEIKEILAEKARLEKESRQEQEEVPLKVAASEKVEREKTQERAKPEQTIQAIQEELKVNQSIAPYSFPPLELLKEPVVSEENEEEQIGNNVKKLEETLQSFGVSAKVINVSKGPTVTRYEIQPAQGVKVSRIVNLSDDIALNLAAAGIRMEAPIPGKSAIGIEVPNREAGSVVLREVLGSAEFQKSPNKLSFGLGKDITGKAVITDIAKMPHLLIAGATGSGKSVCINTLICSLLYKAKPEEVKLVMIDPKVVELSVYNGIPHLLIPVVTDPKKAAGALGWAVQEMNDRYKLFAAAGVRDLKGYNKAVEEKGETPPLPQIVIIIDELADLMMVASNEVEDAICRLAQMARAAGLHLIIATQRPSVDVITGLIKANVPSRIAFNVSSGTDSRTILDMNGAEKLLGKGDMLFYPMGYPKPVRIQGAFISDREVENIVEYLKNQQQSQYNQKIMNHLNKSEESGGNEVKDDLDEFFAEALELVVDKEKASASMLQRYFRIGFNRAARILDQLTEAGYVGEEQGSKPREVLLTRRGLAELKAKANADSEEQTLVKPREAEERPEPAEVPEEQMPELPWEGEMKDSEEDSEEINDAINDLMDEIQSREQDA